MSLCFSPLLVTPSIDSAPLYDRRFRKKRVSRRFISRCKSPDLVCFVETCLSFFLLLVATKEFEPEEM